MQQNELEHTSRYSPNSPVLMMEIQQTRPPEAVAVPLLILALRTTPSASHPGLLKITHRPTPPLLLRYSGHTMVFLLTVVAVGQQVIPGTAQCQRAVDRFEQPVLCQMRCQLNLPMAFLINWNWQKFTPGQCDM